MCVDKELANAMHYMFLHCCIFSDNMPSDLKLCKRLYSPQPNLCLLFAEACYLFLLFMLEDWKVLKSRWKKSCMRALSARTCTQQQQTTPNPLQIAVFSTHLCILDMLHGKKISSKRIGQERPNRISADYQEVRLFCVLCPRGRRQPGIRVIYSMTKKEGFPV